MKLAVTLACLLLSGCALTSESRHRELAWQGLNVADAIQTSQFQYNDCHELGPWRYITGPEPTVERTILAASIHGLLHFGITFALDYLDMPLGLQRAWSYTTLGLTGGQVIHNASLGCD